MVTIYLGETRFPAAPESLKVTGESGNQTEFANGLGEITLCRGSRQREVSFTGYFPGIGERDLFPFCKETPEIYGNLLEEYRNRRQPVRFSLSGGAYPCSFPVTVEKLSLRQEAGSEGLFYELELKEYRSFQQKTAIAGQASAPARADLREKQKTVVHTVVKGDTLWAIARRYLGDGSRYGEIARYNGIANPNLIYPGQEVTILL